jgi:hypothetical protein
MVTFVLNGVSHQFRNPSLGNIDELSFQRINRRTRGGDLIIYRDSDWPKTEVQNLTFTFPKEADAQRMLQLVRNSIGQLMQYTDHENRTWEGIIQNPATELVQTNRSIWTINILFEGDLV